MRTPAMQQALNDLFPEQERNVRLGLCASCGCNPSIQGFEDALSRKEFEISGLCQKCQNEVFTEPDE